MRQHKKRSKKQHCDDDERSRRHFIATHNFKRPGQTKKHTPESDSQYAERMLKIEIAQIAALELTRCSKITDPRDLPAPILNVKTATEKA